MAKLFFGECPTSTLNGRVFSYPVPQSRGGRSRATRHLFSSDSTLGPRVKALLAQVVLDMALSIEETATVGPGIL